MRKKIIFILGLMLVFLGSTVYFSNRISEQESALVQEVYQTGNIRDGKIKFMNITLSEIVVGDDGIVPEKRVFFKETPYFYLAPFAFGLMMSTLVAACVVFIRWLVKSKK